MLYTVPNQFLHHRLEFLASVTQSVERWTSNWNVIGSYPLLEGPCRTISLLSDQLTRVAVAQ